MLKQHVVVLSEEARARLDTLIGRGRSGPRPEHAHILLNPNQGEAGPGWTDRVMATALEIHHTKVARVRQKCAAGGLQAAVDRKAPEHEYRRKLDGEQEAHLVALACSASPEGRKRRTPRPRLLAQRLVQLEVVEARRTRVGWTHCVKDLVYVHYPDPQAQAPLPCNSRLTGH